MGRISVNVLNQAPELAGDQGEARSRSDREESRSRRKFRKYSKWTPSRRR